MHLFWSQITASMTAAHFTHRQQFHAWMSLVTLTMMSQSKMVTAQSLRRVVNSHRAMATPTITNGIRISVDYHWRLSLIMKCGRYTQIPWNLSFHYILYHETRLQTMLRHHNARVNSHQRWKQTRFRVCIHLWCELNSTMNVTEWQVSWNSW